MKKKLLDITRDKLRLMHYSLRTERNYISWIKQYIIYHKLRHPLEMGKKEIELFLTYLAVTRQVAPSTQNQAFYSILFLYKHILDIDLQCQNIQALRAKERIHIPVVLSKEEVKDIISKIPGIYSLMVSLNYGCGLRMKEVLHLRLKDIDLSFNKIYIYDSKSLKDRVVPLPLILKEKLIIQIEEVEKLHAVDTANGFGSVHLPYALAKKSPNAERETKWQYLFPM